MKAPWEMEWASPAPADDSPDPLPFGEDDFNAKRKRTAEWDAHIEAAAADYPDLPDLPRLAKAVMLRESGGDPEAVSSAGASGLMQIMPKTWAGLGRDPGSIFDPVENIAGGVQILAEELRRFGDTRKALAAYNAGPHQVRKYDGIPPFEETQAYVPAVMGYFNALAGTKTNPWEMAWTKPEGAPAPAAAPAAPPEEPRPTETIAPAAGQTGLLGGVRLSFQGPGKTRSEREAEDVAALDAATQKADDKARGRGVLDQQAASPAGAFLSPERIARRNMDAVEPPARPQGVLGKTAAVGREGLAVAGDVIRGATQYTTGFLGRALRGEGLEENLGRRARETEQIIADKRKWESEEGKALLARAQGKAEKGQSLTLDEEEALAENPDFLASVAEFGKYAATQPGKLTQEIAAQIAEDGPFVVLSAYGVGSLLRAMRSAGSAYKAGRLAVKAAKEGHSPEFVARAARLGKTREALKASERALGKSSLAHKVGEEVAEDAAGAALVTLPTETAKGNTYGVKEGAQDILLGTFLGGPVGAFRHLKDTRVSRATVKGAGKVAYLAGAENHPYIQEMLPMFRALAENPETAGIRFKVSPDKKTIGAEEAARAYGPDFAQEFGEAPEVAGAAGRKKITREEARAGGLQKGEVGLYRAGDRETVVEEAAHFLQERLRAKVQEEQVSSGPARYTALADMVKEWEDRIRAAGAEKGVALPKGDELFAQVFTAHMGYADKFPQSVRRVVMPDGIFAGFRKLMSEDPALRGLRRPDGDIAAASPVVGKPKAPEAPQKPAAKAPGYWDAPGVEEGLRQAMQPPDLSKTGGKGIEDMVHPDSRLPWQRMLEDEMEAVIRGEGRGAAARSGSAAAPKPAEPPGVQILTPSKRVRQEQPGLPPRRPAPGTEVAGNFPPPYREPEAMRRALNQVGRRRLDPLDAPGSRIPPAEPGAAALVPGEVPRAPTPAAGAAEPERPPSGRTQTSFRKFREAKTLLHALTGKAPANTEVLQYLRGLGDRPVPTAKDVARFQEESAKELKGQARAELQRRTEEAEASNTLSGYLFNKLKPTIIVNEEIRNQLGLWNRLGGDLKEPWTLKKIKEEFPGISWKLPSGRETGKDQLTRLAEAIRENAQGGLTFQGIHAPDVSDADIIDALNDGPPAKQRQARLDEVEEELMAQEEVLAKLEAGDAEPSQPQGAAARPAEALAEEDDGPLPFQLKPDPRRSEMQERLSRSTRDIVDMNAAKPWEMRWPPTRTQEDIDAQIELTDRYGETKFQLKPGKTEQKDLFDNRGRVASQGVIRAKPNDKGAEGTPLFDAPEQEAQARADEQQTSLFQLKKQAETPEFKRWFGSSKVVDENGEPQVVYHGTATAGFKKFDPKMRGGMGGPLGFWFASSGEAASQFARARYAGEGPGVYPVFLSVQKPMEYQGWKAFVDHVEKLRKGGSIETGMKSLRKGLEQRGYDGVVIRNSDTDMGGLRDDWVAFNPKQIKSSTGNRGTFDPENADITYQLKQDKEAPKRNLAAIHNLSAENLEFADKLGGIAAPSVGITKHDDPFRGFGDISLIGSKHLIDPATGTPVHDADAYTARFPKAEYNKAKTADAQKLINSLRELSDKFDERTVVSLLWDDAVNSPNPYGAINRLMKSKIGKAAFLASRGITMNPKMKARIPRYEWSLGEHVKEVIKGTDMKRLRELGYADPESAAFRKALGDALKKDATLKAEYVAKGKDSGTIEKTKKIYLRNLEDNLLNENGEVQFGFIDSMVDDVRKEGEKVVDDSGSDAVLNKALKGRETEFEAWVKNQILPMHGEPYIKVKGRKAPLTLSNAVEAMTSDNVRGKEKTMTFGTGMARAKMAKSYNSLEEIQADRDNIVGPKHHEEAKEAAEKVISSYRDAALEFFTQKDWRGNVDTWAGLDASMKSLADAAKKRFPKDEDIRAALYRNGFKGVSKDVISMAREALSAMRNVPVDYLEAKPQRGVRLSEFAGAVIPKSTPESTREVLKKHGIPFREYDSSKEGAREAVIAKFTKELNQASDDVLFQLKPSESKDLDEGQAKEDDISLGRSDGSPPRVEEKTAKLRQIEAELGHAPKLLKREVRERWKDLDDETKRLMLEDDAHFYNIMKRRALDPAEAFAWDAKIKGKEEASNEILAKLTAAREKKSPELAGLTADYMASLLDLEAAIGADLDKSGTRAARAMAARARIMKGVRTDSDVAIMRKLAKEYPHLKPGDIGVLVKALRTTPEQFPILLRQAMSPSLLDKAIELRSAGLLSGLGTHIRNLGSNTIEQATKVVETGMAGVVDAAYQKAHGGSRTRFKEDAAAELSGMLDTFPSAWKTTLAGLQSIARLEDKALDHGARYDYQVGAIGGKKGAAIRIPFRLLELSDRVFKEFGGAAELRKRAGWIAREEGLTGNAREKRILEIEKDILEKKNLDQYAGMLRDIEKEVKSRVFQDDPGEYTQMVLRAAKTLKPLRIILPFIKTPVNIFKRTVDRSPLSTGAAFRAHNAYIAALKKGDTPPEQLSALRGAAADQIARTTLGWLLFGGFVGYAMAGGITGGGPPDREEKAALQKTGWQPYSFVIHIPGLPRIYVPFSGFEPLSSMLGASADIADGIQGKNLAKNTEDKLDKIISSVAENLLNKAYMQSLNEVSTIITDAIQHRSGKVARYAGKLAASFIPFSSLLGKTATAIDPTVRETEPSKKGYAALPEQVGRTVTSKLPGLSMTLPAKLDGTGDEAEKQGGPVGRFLGVGNATIEKESAKVFRELERIHYVPEPPPKEIQVPGMKGRKERLTEEERKMFLAARAKATEKLRAWVERPAWQNADDEKRKELAQKIYEDAYAPVRKRVRLMVRRRVLQGS